MLQTTTSDAREEALRSDPPNDATSVCAKKSESSLEVNGWRFHCASEPAMSSDARDALAHELRLKPLVSLPEMVFAANVMLLEHKPTGLAIHFRAEDALRMWADAHADDE